MSVESVAMNEQNPFALSPSKGAEERSRFHLEITLREPQGDRFSVTHSKNEL